MLYLILLLGGQQVFVKSTEKVHAMIYNLELNKSESRKISTRQGESKGKFLHSVEDARLGTGELKVTLEIANKIHRDHFIIKLCACCV